MFPICVRSVVSSVGVIHLHLLTCNFYNMLSALDADVRLVTIVPLVRHMEH